MLFKLSKISVMPLAKILCILHAVVGLILGLIVTLGSLLNQDSEGLWGLGAWAILVLPLVNAVLGFVTGFFLASAYNIISQWLDQGIELEFEHLDAVSLKNQKNN
ncbi:MAG: hypothetical protein HQL15_09565 [Candidatus Omnitrophica bacterium]|nr:hypothetical protein [Candidatus Omnitrophota bacterium]